MHKTQEASLRLKEVLAKLRGDKVAYTAIYSPRDKAKAKSVLDRLLHETTRCEVSYMRPIPTEVSEPDE